MSINDMPGRPFVKNDPRRGPGGRPRQHPKHSVVGMEIQDAIIKILQMTKDKAIIYMQKNPTLIDTTAWKYINDYPSDVVDRFCGRVPQPQEITGRDGEPLIPSPVAHINLDKLTADQIEAQLARTERLILALEGKPSGGRK